MRRYLGGWDRAERYARLVGERVESAIVTAGANPEHFCPELHDRLRNALPLTVAQLHAAEEALGEDASKWLLRAS